jgi:hypothetical protein|eukprot:SAG25_NODE_667_length_6052_cov_7.366202_7_plen_44_part_00
MGGSDGDWAALFRKYDKDESGSLELEGARPSPYGVYRMVKDGQ